MLLSTDTAELTMRFGIHSGPVTVSLAASGAGIIRVAL